MTINIMIDLETMGVGLNPAILEISAIAFDDRFKVIEEFSTGVSLLSSIIAGLEINQSTVDFWKSQSDDAKGILLKNQDCSLRLNTALSEFSNFVKSVRGMDDCEKILLFGNGSTNDNVWMMSAYKACGMNFDEVVLYNEHACYRQKIRDAKSNYGIWIPEEIDFDGVKHYGLDDCKHQIRCLNAIEILDNTDHDFLDEVISTLNERV